MDLNNLSRTLSYTLRHNPPPSMSSDGFVSIPELLKLKQFSKWTKDDIYECVSNNSKQRFSIIGDKIRANQGHSVKVPDLELIKIDNIDTPVIHGTYRKYWPQIESNGLSCMNRQHIHFTTALPNKGTVISGMRSDCNCFIYINFKKAIEEGFVFYKSSNNVILCSGNTKGIIPSKYFEKVVFVPE